MTEYDKMDDQDEFKVQERPWDFRPPYLFEGQSVAVVWKKQIIKCIVIMVSGDDARVTNERRGIDTWIRREDVKVQRPIGPQPTGF